MFRDLDHKRCMAVRAAATRPRIDSRRFAQPSVTSAAAARGNDTNRHPVNEICQQALTPPDARRQQPASAPRRRSAFELGRHLRTRADTSPRRCRPRRSPGSAARCRRGAVTHHQRPPDEAGHMAGGGRCRSAPSPRPSSPDGTRRRRQPRSRTVRGRARTRQRRSGIRPLFPFNTPPETCPAERNVQHVDQLASAARSASSISSRRMRPTMKRNVIVLSPGPAARRMAAGAAWPNPRCPRGRARRPCKSGHVAGSGRRTSIANCVIQPRHSPATVSRRSGDAAGRCARRSRRPLTSPPPGARHRPSPPPPTASRGRRRRPAPSGPPRSAR